MVKDRKGGGKLEEIMGVTTAAACPPVASRVKLRPASPALDPTGRRGGRGEGS
jgi:hypothetical protein